MRVRVVEEGAPFEITGEDRAHLARLLRGSLQWREDGVAVWGVVGHLRLPSGDTLAIRSKKAPAACLLSWASYVDPSLSDLKNVRQLDDVGDDGDVGEALAVLFVRELLAVAGAHGIRRRYRRVPTRSATIRGSIDFAALSRAGGDLSRTPCIVWERLPKTPLNQLFASALRLIRRDQLMRQAVGGILNDLEAVFADVPPVNDPDLMAGRRPLERDELPFGSACALARLLLRDAGVSTGEDERGLGFIVRLDSLFEKAVVKALRDAGLDAEPKVPVMYTRLASHNEPSTRGQLILDCFLRRPGLDGVVIDAKYKSDAPSSIVDQMVTYCHLTGVANAVLVFPSGQLADLRPFELRSPAGNAVHVRLMEFEASGRSLANWRANAQEFAGELVTALSRA
jgi:hypothetical protein